MDDASFGIELQLISGAVIDTQIHLSVGPTHGLEDDLFGWQCASDGVEGLFPMPVFSLKIEEELQTFTHFFEMTREKERAAGEIGIAYPAKAIVPVIIETRIG